jgi:ribosomal protein L40E
MAQPSFSLQEQPPKPAPKRWYVLSGGMKMGLLAFVGAVLYLRLINRQRQRKLVCSHCGERNPHHLVNCKRCSAPLFRGQ